MDDLIIQEDELLALKSIYFEEFEVSKKEDLPAGKYYAYVDLPDNFKVVWGNVREKDPQLQSMPLEYLPPVVLTFKLPKDYPSKSPPDFTLSCQWLRVDQVVKLCNKLDEMWSENVGNEILFLWASFLKEDLLKFLNISDTLDVSVLYTRFITLREDKSLAKLSTLTENLKLAGGSVENVENHYCEEGEWDIGEISGAEVKDSRVVSDGGKIPLVQTLAEFNKEKQREVFQRRVFKCNICYLSVLGAHCVRFEPCGHVFCQVCVKDYFEFYIRERRVQNIGCPEVKCTSVALPWQVKDAVTEELFGKYDRILLSSLLDTMSDVTYCPVPSCQYPVIREPNEKMATCPACGYVFCIYCKMVYHGIEPCRYKANEKQRLVKEYQSASPEIKLQMEKRYGKKQLKYLVDSAMSEEWIDTHSKSCPHCKACIEKSDGCNKMTCWNCKTYFCWLCMAQLNQRNPYEHYTSPSSKCVDMLFHGIHIEEQEMDEDEYVVEDYPDLPDTEN